MSYNPKRQASWFGLSSVSLAATQEIAFAFFSSGYLDVSVPRVCLLLLYVFKQGYCPITNSGFPHSEISGSKLTYSSPKHIGVSPVLHRLLVPRHPPCALYNLTKLVSYLPSIARIQELLISKCYFDAKFYFAFLLVI